MGFRVNILEIYGIMNPSLKIDGFGRTHCCDGAPALSFFSCLKFYFFFSVIETSKPVKLKDFSEHYRIMSADSDFRFSEEYEELKHVGREKPCTGNFILFV